MLPIPSFLVGIIVSMIDPMIAAIGIIAGVAFRFNKVAGVAVGIAGSVLLALIARDAYYIILHTIAVALWALIAWGVMRFLKLPKRGI
jgi:hypothetical protein